MSVGVLLVTHGRLGRHLIETVTEMMGTPPLAIEVVDIQRGQDPDSCVAEALEKARCLDSGDGVLMLTDAFGSTPSNVATKAAAQSEDYRIVAGLNLPMLIRIFNYPEKNLASMIENAVQGGRQGIISGENDLG
ncbi:MAG: PTS fructose transporter subunit IIA [Salinisphaeraceae bacterium]|nr:PTS fructose transporter subunit IIA [Salinisphaeraceae bacterium]